MQLLEISSCSTGSLSLAEASRIVISRTVENTPGESRSSLLRSSRYSPLTWIGRRWSSSLVVLWKVPRLMLAAVNRSTIGTGSKLRAGLK